MLPAISTEGKIYMKSKSDISMSPNGNGALLSAIHMNQEIKDYFGKIDYI
jgi:UDP-N-acetylglucosamine pyrophosphorylase